MTQDPFAAPNGTPDGDPFAAPAAIISEYPEMETLRGRLLMFKPSKFDANLSSAKYPEKKYDRITTDVHVIDGGPVPAFDTTSFTDMYVSQSRILAQLKQGLENRHMVLGRLNTYKPGKAEKGNPWGLTDPTEADKAAARAFIAAGYKQAAPQYAAPVQPAPAAAPVSTAPTGYNPYSVPAAAPIPAQVSSNPFG
jgi:hypothetical protein